MHVQTGGLTSSGDGNYLQNIRETDQKNSPPNQVGAEMHTIQLTSPQHLIFGEYRSAKPKPESQGPSKQFGFFLKSIKELTSGQNVHFSINFSQEVFLSTWGKLSLRSLQNLSRRRSFTGLATRLSTTAPLPGQTPQPPLQCW